MITYVITDPGYGYSSPPDVFMKGMLNSRAVATLSFDPDFSKNGSVKSLSTPPLQ